MDTLGTSFAASPEHFEALVEFLDAPASSELTRLLLQDHVEGGQRGDPAGVRGDRGTDLSGGVAVPPADQAVVAARRQHRVPIGGGPTRHRPHRGGVSGQRLTDNTSGLGVPDPDRAVVAGRGQTRVAVRTDASVTSGDRVAMPALS